MIILRIDANKVPMLPRSFVLISAAALLVCALSNAASQTNRSAVKNLPVRPLDTTLDRLPPGFAGQSIVAIFQAVAHRTDLQKSEFEAAAQYQDRIASIAHSRLLGDLPLDGTVAIVVPCDAWEPDKECARYDAETQTLNVLLPFDSAAPGALAEEVERVSPRARSVQILEDRGPRTPAGMAQNGFGARFPISRQSITRYYVETMVPVWFNRSTKEAPGERDPMITISMDPETAMHAKGAVRELFVGHLSAPFLGEIEDAVSEATASDPVRANIHIRTVHMDIEEVWFFNARTGQVYRKIRPDLP